MLISNVDDDDDDDDIGRNNPLGGRDLYIHAARRSGEPNVSSRTLNYFTIRQHAMPKHSQINCLRSDQRFQFTTSLQ